ncbi:IPT/TIG domain-containing protein [Arthrobacter sp. 35/47]|uniref:IPT/TIG domain-containing protein n=1 Tax=Arthrobacter sp. 35/47 TaxID=269454 RepID=UPI0009FCCA33|nr:IPT/TIG domain-containing protein [Arthrobacter sp. 35/47]
MSPRWSTARVTAIATALAIGGSAVVAAPTLALPGDAEASAVDLRLSLELGGASLLDVDAAAETESPPREVVIPDLSAHVGALNGAAVAGRATLSTASGAAGTTSSAVIEDLTVSVLGVQAVGATRVISAAECLPGALPAAETASEGVTVLGTPVDPAAVPVAGLELSTAATVPGMTSAEVLAKVKVGTISRNAASAEATGLTVNLTLKGTVPDVGMVAAIYLGNIVIGEAACEHLEVPSAPTAEELVPAEGVSTGSDTVTLRGSGFTGDTTVDVGGNAATDVVVLSDSELTFSTPAGPVGPSLVTVTTPSGSSTGLGFTYTEPAPEVPVVDVLDPDETAATGGEEIWIFGSGFARDRTSVTVGETVISPSDVEFLNTGTLVIKAPAQPAGLASLSVTTPVGSSGSLDLNYFPVAVPPTITSVTPDSGPMEGNTSVTLRGTGFVPAATMVTMDTASFLDDDVTVVSDTELSFIVPAGTEGPVNIDVTTAAGTSNTVVYTYTATAPPPPPPAGMEGHDFNGDGTVDVLARDSAGRLWLYPGNGAAGWLAKKQVGSGWQSMTAILGPGDFDGDANADVLARDSAGRLWLYPGNGSAGWLTKALVGSSWNGMTGIL